MKFKYYRFVLIFSMMVLSGLSHQAFSQDLGKYEALYIYNFTKYIKFPGNGENLTIGAMGDGSIHDELDKMVKMKGDGKLVYKKLNSVNDISGCDIIFIGKSEDRNLASILEKTQGKSVLVIAENEVSAQHGAAISFYMDGDKLKFIINKGVIDTKKMQVSSSLMTLAKVI